MKNSKIIPMVIVIFIFFCYPFLYIKEVEATDNKSDMLFSVTPVLPKNQQNKQVSYYDLRTKPDQEQTIVTLVENYTDQELPITIDYNNAKTNSNSIRDYTNNQLLEDDASLKVKFNEIVSGPKEVLLKPREVLEVETQLRMPSKAFDGVISGGIQFSHSDRGQPKETNNEVIMDLSYIVGMTISQNDKKITPEFELRTIKPGFIDYENAFLVSLANVKPLFIDDLTIDSEITKKGLNNKVYRNKKKNVQMSPNSKIDFPVSLQGDDMEDGEYTSTVRVTTREGEKRVWTKDFILTKKDVSYFNKQQKVFTEKKDLTQSISIGFILIISLLVCLVVASVYLVYKYFFIKK